MGDSAAWWAVIPSRFFSRLCLRAVTLLAAAACPVWADDPFHPPPGYYDRAFGLTGGALETVLHEIIRNHTVQPYTWAFQFDAWDALKVLDRDPNNPARVIEVFTGASLPTDDTNGGGNPNITSLSWEREHLWPRSYGVGQSGAAFSDLFNLRPINQAVNQTRGNRIFDDPGPDHPTDPAAPVPGAPEARYDPAGEQGSLWAPRPVEKAEIARAMFYMQVRYDGRDEETVDLRLSDDPDTGPARFGRLSTLLDWHRAGDVSDAERRRNHILFTEHQGNRNPFVDNPGYVDRVFSGAPPPAGLNVMVSRSVLAMDDGVDALSGVVALSEPAVTDTVVTLQADRAFPGLSVPATVTVETGQSTAVFTVDAAAAGPPPFQTFRHDWRLTAGAPGFGHDDAGVTLLGAGGRGWETFDRLLIYGSAYRDGSFIGQNGIRWRYFHATSEQNFSINGRGILLRGLSEGSRIVSDPISGGINRLAIDLRKAFSGSGGRQVEVLINGVSRGVSPVFGAASGSSAAVLTYTLDNLGVEGDFTLEIRNAAGLSDFRQLVVDNIRWTGWPDGAAPAPALEAFPDRLSLPGYRGGAGPGGEKRFRVWGTHLNTGTLVAEAPAGFEIAFDDGPFAESLILPAPVKGMTAVFLRARLRADLAPGTAAGSLVVSGGGADAFAVALTGTVTESPGHLVPGLLADGYGEDFSGFAQTGELPLGWELSADGSAGNRLDLSAWGTTATGIKRGSTADPLLGYQHTANTGTVVMWVEVENRSGKTVRALDIQYRGRANRLAETRYPHFTTRVNGAPRSSLAYSSAEGDGMAKRDRFGGLFIPPGAMMELSWTSDRGPGTGASRQIGLSDLRVTVPAPPVVTLVGPGDVLVEQGSEFTDPGAEAVDEFDGALPVSIAGSVDTAVPGVATLTYGAVNSVGLTADPVSRTVTVLRPVDYFTLVTHGLEGGAASPTAAPAGDGVANLLKFALGGDPRKADRSVLPVPVRLTDGRLALGFRNGPELVWDDANSRLAGAGLELYLEWSADLSHWNPAPADRLTPGGGSVVAPDSEILLAPGGPLSEGAFFLRLRVVMAFD